MGVDPPTQIVLYDFLTIQQRRAEAYSKLKRFVSPCRISVVWGFLTTWLNGGELAYKQLCSEMTIEFIDCLKKVLEMEALFRSCDYCRIDLAQLLRTAVQDQEKQNLFLAYVTG
ncbi:hypothetical protein PHAVU_005G010900 [Phaseolus vulgaris]|uniref:Uncharacterized protein n=1 Tax=Phaseolus vulgaris TaxID=3885 RepID=V7BS12_PHAVU|nr:hypothetical protein PHAVU_005G010900g [Phaseolus vulgaris]ESW20744.1 hypothetical protein PHAVU_005G010900g [Phaseolus vulgaris]